jgi:hypothetical protein
MTSRKQPQRRRIERPREELGEMLRQQYWFLRRSSDAYDRGEHDESRRLALSVRVLVHKTANSSPLLEQLGLLERLRFVDTALRVPVPGLVLGGAALAITRINFGDGRCEYVPPLDDLSPERINMLARFHDWWTERIIRTDDGIALDRRALVLGMANTDGGAHVDQALDEDYVRLRQMTGNVSSTIGDVPVGPFAGSLAHASMRQIAHEMQRTLDRDWRTEHLRDAS